MTTSPDRSAMQIQQELTPLRSDDMSHATNFTILPLSNTNKYCDDRLKRKIRQPITLFNLLFIESQYLRK